MDELAPVQFPDEVFFELADNVATIIAIELLAACQGIEFRRPARLSALLESIHARVRELVPAYDQDRFFAPDIEAIKGFVLSGALREMVPLDLSFNSSHKMEAS